MRYQMLKRDMKLFLHCLLPAMVLTTVFAAVCAIAGLAAVNNAKDVYTPVRAAVVDRGDSAFNRMLIRAIAKTDYISALLEVSACDMDTAMEGMESGELSAVIVLPEGVVDGITTGSSTKGEIYLSSSVAAYADIVKSIAAFGELLLATGQYGVFSGQHLIWKYDLGEQFHSKFLSKVNPLLLGEGIGAASSYFDVQVLDYAGTGMSTEAYYAVSWAALLIMLLPLFLARLYTQDLKKPMLCRLRGAGIKDRDFLLGKIACPAAFQAVVLAVILYAVKGQVVPSVGIVPVLCALAGVIVSAVVCCFLMMLGYRGVSLLIVIALTGLLLCGGIIPRQMLPEGLLAVGAMTPYGIVQTLLMPIWGGRFRWSSCGMGAAYVVIASAAVYARLRYVRIGGDEV
ncbi:MAG: ABC transporter permease [Ruminococcaceae bacterium]|nr:ABC transporter permease [Oscillospiraceae bacterium]